MISKAQIKRIRLLHKLKGRQEQKKFLVEGIRAVEEVLKSNLNVNEVYIVSSESDNENKVPGYEHYKVISEKQMNAISALRTPPGILAVVDQPPPLKKPDTDKDVVVLDGIKDPGNLGTIMRTAHWFGINQIICSNDCVDVYNPKTVQSTMGSIGYVKVVVLDLLDFIRTYNSHFFFAGMQMEGTDIKMAKTDLKNIALIIGSEAFGISDEVSRLLDESISILPHDNQNKPESLNASIAAAIGMFHFMVSK